MGRDMKMWRNYHRMKSLLILIIIIFLPNLFYLSGKLQETENYKVGVNARIVPIFAVNASGEGVFDLKKEEIEFIVNGQRKAIDTFICYRVETTKIKPSERAVRIAPVQATGQRLNRCVILVLDTIFNSPFGIRRMKELAAEVVNKGQAGDFFLLLGINPSQGIHFLAGPETPRAEMVKKIGKLSLLAPSEEVRQYFKRKSNDRVDVENLNPSYEDPSYFSANDGYEGKLTSQTSDSFYSQAVGYVQFLLSQNERSISDFISSISYLDRLLSMIVQPKVVFLFSEGIMWGSFWEEAPAGKQFNSFYFSQLQEAVRKINRSGASFFTVNPGRVDSSISLASGTMSVQYLARESGGEFFQGTDKEKLGERIDSATSAYYELAYSVEEDRSGAADEIVLRCLRPGVRLYSPKTVAGYRKFTELNETEREAYLWDALRGGLWSKTLGRIRPLAYTILERTREGETWTYAGVLIFPAEWKGRRVELNVITLDPMTMATKRQMREITVRDQEAFRIESGKKWLNYLVVLNPSSGDLLVAQVK